MSNMDPLKADEVWPEASRFFRRLRWKPTPNDTPVLGWELLVVRALWEVLERIDALEEQLADEEDLWLK